ALATDILTRYCHLVQQHAYPNLKSLSRLAVTYMKDHLSDNLTVKGIAQILSVNADYLSNQFHKEMGETCMAFINRERVTQAAALLRNTDLQIQQIATMVGYNNTSYFAKQFKKIFHQSPQTYRLH
ncbi:MAG: helix-turn-helix transcriptional regulator, partial [Clostridia bacterium]|nr:helix-turn-helix transcriptional regulator [Clostridia bacterium]